jgi:hypothetical protein
MYACIRETRRGFFEGVCTLRDQARISSDPLPSPNANEPEPHYQDSGRRRSRAVLP